jgi:hypothetical protein
MRTYLLNFFNGGQLDENNIATGGATYTSLAAPPDDTPIKWESSHATLKYDATNDKFEIKNTQGDINFGLNGAANYLGYIDEQGHIRAEGGLSINTSTGSQAVSTSWLLAKYRRPRLEYTSSTVVTAENNSPNSSETLVLIRDRLCVLADRSLSVSSTANGYVSDDTGAAVSGMADAADGTLTPNRWYYIYVVKVAYGSDNDGTKAIMVARTTPPITSNISSLTSAMGNWVYIGCFRYGYNDGESLDSVVVPFVYDENGYCRFTQTTDDGEGLGVTLAENTTTANLEYTLTFDNDSGANIPPVATRATFHGYREINGTEFHYRSTLTDENSMIVTGCYHTSLLSTMYACLQMEVPVIDGYKLVVTNGSVETDCRITLAGFQDHFA